MGFDTRGSMPVTCPFTCSKNRNAPFVVRFLFLEIDRILTRVEGGAVLREQNALPYKLGLPFACQAKVAIDNCRAGRAAKGATLGKAKENASIFRHRINSPQCSN